MDTPIIEHGIEVRPPKGRLRALKTMEVGDSILVTDMPSTCLRVSVLYYADRYKKGYTVRKVEGGYRVWRTA